MKKKKYKNWTYEQIQERLYELCEQSYTIENLAEARELQEERIFREHTEPRLIWKNVKQYFYLRQISYTCQYCELLGICRDSENKWKCLHGCMIINEREARERKKKQD